VLFAEILGLDAVFADNAPDLVLMLLNDLIVSFDEAAERCGVEKVKTIGSTYLAVCGMSVQRPDHTNRTVEFALELQQVVERFNRDRSTKLSIQIGINAGPVVGGIVGRNKFIYDLWGDTVNVARGLSADGPSAGVRVTRCVYDRVQELHSMEPVGEVEIKGKGSLDVWKLLPRKVLGHRKVKA